MAVFLANGVGLVLAFLLLLIGNEARPVDEAMLWAALAGASGAVGLGFFYLALARGTMGLVAPMTALISATVAALVGIARGDAVGPLILLGMGAALAAVVLISLPDRGSESPATSTDQRARAGEWVLIVVGGLGFAGFFLGIDASHQAGGEVWWPLFMVKLAGLASITAVALVLLALGRARPVRIGIAVLLMGSLAGVGDLGGNLFFVLASGTGELAVVVVLSSLYPVTTAILAKVFLHERLGSRGLAGAALAVGGVVLIGVGSL